MTSSVMEYDATEACRTRHILGMLTGLVVCGSWRLDSWQSLGAMIARLKTDCQDASSTSADSSGWFAQR